MKANNLTEPSMSLLYTTEGTSTCHCFCASPTYLFLLNGIQDNVRNVWIFTFETAMLLIIIFNESFWHCIYGSRVPYLSGLAVQQWTIVNFNLWTPEADTEDDRAMHMLLQKHIG